MKKLWPLFVVLFFSCAEIVPLVDYNPQTDFATFKSFNVCEEYKDDETPNHEHDNAENRQIITDLLIKKIEKLGYVYDEVSPDLLVSFDLKFEEQVINYTSCREKDEFGFWSECELVEYPYTAGTIVVTMLDNAFNQVVWIGSVEDVWPDHKTPKFKGQMNKFIDAMFLEFPLEKSELEKI